ncbi:MAG: endonuclease/exonuclease/phosphatase family protein [Termitinemataceae bacterium]|nr:MAG: endonuclease/exonuclease/phosphatase family protein [Termitinemataceae bacterium]
MIILKNYRRNFLALLVLAAALLMTSCLGGCDTYPDTTSYGGKSGKKLSVASWNMQALFDGAETGSEYADYSKEAGWNEQKYLARLNADSDAIMQIGERGPDFLALIEVENQSVLETLGTEYLAKCGYNYSFFTNTQGYSLGVGVLSRYPFTKKLSHSSNINGERIPRPIAEVWIEPDGKPIVIFICHWKSKLGGESTTEIMRRNAAKIILRRINQINAENQGTAIIVLGDLNENYDEFYRNSCEYICAIMPDDPQAAILTGFALPAQEEEDDAAVLPKPIQDFFILSSEKPPVSAFFDGASGVFYSPWSLEMQNGSYYYGSNWETIDHFLLSPTLFDESGWEFDSALVVDTEPFVNSKNEPAIYNPRTGSGLSDHLPILLNLIAK